MKKKKKITKRPRRGKGRSKKTPIRNNGYKRQLADALAENTALRERIAKISAELPGYMAASESIALRLEDADKTIKSMSSSTVKLTPVTPEPAETGPEQGWPFEAARIKLCEGGYILSVPTGDDINDDVIESVESFAKEHGVSIMVVQSKPGRDLAGLYRVEAVDGHVAEIAAPAVTADEINDLMDEMSEALTDDSVEDGFDGIDGDTGTPTATAPHGCGAVGQSSVDDQDADLAPGSKSAEL